jgi:hypothetical protein
MKQCHCPNDGMAIPQVAEVLESGESVRFYWCWSCAELFADFDHSAGTTIGFAENGKGGWVLFRSTAPDRELEIAIAAIEQVRPDRTAWDRLQVSRAGVGEHAPDQGRFIIQRKGAAPPDQRWPRQMLSLEISIPITSDVEGAARAVPAGRREFAAVGPLVQAT